VSVPQSNMHFSQFTPRTHDDAEIGEMSRLLSSLSSSLAKAQTVTGAHWRHT